MRNLLDGLFEKFREFENDVIIGQEIEYPLEINGINNLKRSPKNEKVGSFVSIRPVAEEYENKTFLGIYLGDLILENNILFNKKSRMVDIVPYRNPAIFVFDLNKIIWGRESWWGFIKSEDNLKQITDYDIENVWYVKALRKLQEEK